MNREWEGTSGQLGVVGVRGRVREIIVELYCRLRARQKLAHTGLEANSLSKLELTMCISNELPWLCTSMNGKVIMILRCKMSVVAYTSPPCITLYHMSSDAGASQTATLTSPCELLDTPISWLHSDLITAHGLFKIPRIPLKHSIFSSTSDCFRQLKSKSNKCYKLNTSRVWAVYLFSLSSS